MECKQNDDYLVCDECGKQCIFGDCPDHGPLEWVDDSHPVIGTQQKNQARSTIPSNLYLMPSAVGQGQMGVFTRGRIEKRVMFGPFKGQKIPVKEMNFGEDNSFRYMWDVLKGSTVSHIVDGTDEQHSNWMRFVNCARDSKEQNLVAVQFRDEIYYKTCTAVEPGSELLVWYNESVSMTVESSSQKDQNSSYFVCDVCGLVSAGSTFLLRHKSVRCPGKPTDQANTSERHEAQADEPKKSLVEGKGNDVDSTCTLPCDEEPQYVVVHIGGPSKENSSRIVEETSPYVVVHVEPAPSSNTGRLRRGKQGRPLIDDRKSKTMNTRKRSAESGKKTKQINSKSTLSKSRKTPSSNGTKARNTAAKKRTPAGTKRKATSANNGSKSLKSGGGMGDKGKKKKVTEPKESKAKTKATKSKAAEDESMQEQTVGDASPKSRKKSKAQPKKRKRPSEEEEETPAAAEDGTAEKRPRKTTPRKTRQPRVNESERDPTDPSQKPSPTKRKRTAPQDKPIFTCEKCLRNFKWQSALNYHMRSHADEKEFKCTFCDKALSQLSSLKRHLRVHSGEKPYECEECGLRFAEKGKLKFHQRKHTGEQVEKKYKCSLCERRFMMSANLTTHMRTHTGEKPYPCPQCGKGFKRSSDIISHLRSHTGERPYKCSHCAKSFKMISHRNRHEAIHSGVKPFKCDLCGKGFTQPNSVKAHLKVHARKQAKLDGRKPEKMLKDGEMQTDGPHGKDASQSNGSEQLQINNAERNGTQEPGVASGEGQRLTEEFQSVITELMETEPLQLDSVREEDLKLIRQSNQETGEELEQLDSSQELQPGHLPLDSAEVVGEEAQEFSSREGTELTNIAAEQLQLSCTAADNTGEQLNADNTLINGKKLLQLGSAAQSDVTEQLQLELTPITEQEQVQLVEGNETTLLAL